MAKIQVPMPGQSTQQWRAEEKLHFGSTDPARDLGIRFQVACGNSLMARRAVQKSIKIDRI